jgi:hypothetical protein
LKRNSRDKTYRTTLKEFITNKTSMKYFYTLLTAISLLLIAKKSDAQDLDPRVYARIPVNVTVLVAGFGYSHGGVLTDPSVPIQDLSASLEIPSFAVAHSFSLFGKTAQASAALPFAWAQLSGTVSGAAQSTTRTGLGDMRLKLSVLLIGAPAATIGELAKAKRKTVIGTSITVVAPTGQYYSEKLINLGTSRWSIKPELALSQPFGERWLFDLYAGLWVFTENNSFYPGSSIRDQHPMGSFQTHLSYNIQPLMWVAFDATFYTGGNTTVNGTEMNDRQSNSRVGATMVLPVGKRNSVKFAFSRGAIIRYGANFTTVSIGWQTSFFKIPSPAAK